MFVFYYKHIEEILFNYYLHETDYSHKCINYLPEISSRNDATLLLSNPATDPGQEILMPRGPQLPVTVQKANREDINDKFCKFEINKACITPLREEQMSEAWSLDADAPESIINDPLLDENTSLANLSQASSMNQNGPNNNSLCSNSRVNSHNNISGSQSNGGNARLITNANSFQV